MTHASVTSFPSLITLARILSEPKPLIIVSLSTLFWMSSLWVLSFSDESKSFGVESSKLMSPRNSLFSSTIMIKALDFEKYIPQGG